MPVLSGAVPAPDPLGQAEAAVAAYICPTLPDLTVRTWVLDYRARNVQRAYGLAQYGTRRLGPEELRRWPLTGLDSIVQDGLDITADCSWDSFSVRRDSLTPEFMPGAVLTVTYRTGWMADTLPEAVKQAILLTAQDMDARPVGVVSEKLGDVSNTYGKDSRGLVPAAAALLAPWRYVGV